MKMKIFTILFVIIIVSSIVIASQPKVPQIDKDVVKAIKNLKYSNIPEDESNLKELLRLYQENKWYDCNPYCEEINGTFFSYPKELLLNKILLTSDKKYNPDLDSRLGYLDIQIIEEKNLDEAFPYLINYLEENESNRGKLGAYFDLLIKYDQDVISLLRNKLPNIRNYNVGHQYIIITNLAKLNDIGSYNYIFDFCKEDIYDHINECIEIFTYYRNHEFYGYVIENMNKEFESGPHFPVFRKYIFPPFALNKSIYSIYTETVVSYNPHVDRVKIWKEWYKSNKDKIIWSEDLSKFIEEGTEEEIKEYLSKEKGLIEDVEKVGYFKSLINWFRRLFR